jgi:hypothetical protein
MARHMKQEEPREYPHPRYPKWAIAWGIISVLVALSSITQYQYGPDEQLALIVDFVIGVLVTFGFWYGLTVLVGFVYRKIKERTAHA